MLPADYLHFKILLCIGQGSDRERVKLEYMDDGNVRGKVRLDQTFLDLDPLIKDFAQVCNIDLTVGTNPPEYDLFNLHTAFLITNHPGIDQAIKTIRQKLGIKKLVLFRIDYDHCGTCFNCTLDRLKEPIKNLLNRQVDKFFASVGKNLIPDEWHDEIATLVLTGILPLPPVASFPFELHPKIDEQLLTRIKNFPILVFKKRVREKELNQIINYLKDTEYGLTCLTAHLPVPPVKRRDVDLKRLAAGLWSIKTNSSTFTETEKRLSNEYDKYLREKNIFYNTEGLIKLSADAKNYLAKLCPL